MKLILALLMAIGFSFSAVAAEEFPTIGLLFNTKESSSLTYDCVLGKDDKLRCDFLQTSIRKKTSKLEVSDRIAKIREQYKNEKVKGEKSGEFSTPSAEECVMWRDGLDILSGKKSAPNGVDINASMSIVEREDNKRIVEALLGTCGNPTLQSFVNLAQVAGEKELKTCNASSNKYSQLFKRVKGSDGKEVWVVESLADGECGAVRLDVFSAEVINNYSYWSYTARKVITNPKGKTAMGLECSRFDQDEYLYSWKSRETAMECTYINFSPL